MISTEKEIWFVTGSQHLYGPETLKQVAQNANTIANGLDASSKIDVKIVSKNIVTTPDEITAICIEANTTKNCIGIITWMHTFSPAKMWIAGLNILKKPLCHFHTQFNAEIPWNDIDMDFMNLNQSAHGDREFGFMMSRMRQKRKVIVGHWKSENVQKQLGVWTRVALGWDELQHMKVARIGDNMRQVAVTEGDKVQAQMRFGLEVNGYDSSDVVKYIDAVTDKVRFSQEMDKKTGFETRSILCHPITNREDKVIGVIEVLNKRNQNRFTEEDEKTMKVLALIFSCVFHNYNPISEKSLIRRFSTPYDREFAYIGRSSSTIDIRRSIVKLKDIDTPLCINGEVGVGKKLLSQIIHNEGKRGLNKFHIISCKGSDPKAVEEKLFGINGEGSVLEDCKGGSIVFDEISYLPLDLQSRLFSVLQTRKIPDGDITLDIRPIFTTSRDLDKLANEEGVFNIDFYQYIQTTILNVDPLRKRLDDIKDLCSYFLRKECRRQGLLLKEISDDVLEKFKQYDWPGNVIELQNAIAKAVLYNPKAHVISKIEKGSSPIIDLSKSSMHGLDNIPHARDYHLNLKERVLLVEREMILAEIRRNKGNKSKAAKEMGISREALRKKLLQSDEVLENISADDMKKAA